MTTADRQGTTNSGRVGTSPASTATRAAADAFVSHLATGDVEALLGLFAEGATWEVPGDSERVPWVGLRQHEEIPTFFSSMAEVTTREAFDIDRVLVDGRDAVLLGRAKLTYTPEGTLIDVPFAIHLAVDADGRIERLLMLEDSYSVARAVRPAIG